MRQHKWTSAYIIGTEEQKKEFRQHGIQLDEQNAQVVIASLDEQLNYQQLDTACQLLHRGAIFIATNADAHYIAEDGVHPDTGAIVQFLRTATGKEPLFTGKPSSIMIDMVLETIGIPTQQIAIIGDQMDIDMKIAEEYGMVSVLVLSGQTKREDLMNYAYQPDYVVDSVESLIPLFS